MGGGAGEHAVPGRPGADGRDGPLRGAVEASGRAARPRDRVPPGRLAPRRGPRGDPRPARRRRGSRRQGRVRRPQRDVHRRHQRHPGRPPRDRPRGPPGAAAGRHHLVAGVDRLPPRRLGRRRHRGRLAEGADAAAGPVVQRDQRQGARGVAHGAPAARLLGLGRDRRGQRQGLLANHARHQSPLRAAGGARPAAGGGATQRVRAPRPARGGDAARGARLGPRDPVRRTRRRTRAR